MIVLIGLLFFMVQGLQLFVAHFVFVAAVLGMLFELMKLAWRLTSGIYNKLRGRRVAARLPTMAIARATPLIGSADVRALKADRPLNSRLSNYYKS